MKKLCKECEWSCNFSLNSESEIAYCCNHPKNINKESRVTGEKMQKEDMCITHRSICWLSSVLFGYCGKSGRWFEPRKNPVPKGEWT